MNETDNWTGEGYDAASGSGGGVYLRLKAKGDKVRLRLVSPCYRFYDTIKDNVTGEEKPIRKCAWLAIHKEIVSGAPTKRVVVFQSGPMVYGLIKDLVESDGWGDPQEFDIEVTRTEETGKYYTVTPFPKPMGPISDEERQLVAEAGLNLIELCKRKSDSVAATPGAQQPADYDPFAES